MFLIHVNNFYTFAIDASQAWFARQQLSLPINPPYPRLVDAEATLQEAQEALERHARQMVSRWQQVDLWKPSVKNIQFAFLGGFEL